MSVLPQKSDINSLFGTKEFYIDFYQREYKWKKDHVIKLLDDIFHRFELDYDPSKDANNENISKYDWYYLSSFITNIYQGNTYIVDGQQRLTTLTLILVSLYHLAVKFNTDLLKKVIESKIFGATTSGLKYWMGQDGRAPILMELVRSQTAVNSNGNISYINMIKNYKDINDYLNNKLNGDHKFSCFVLFYLHKIFLVHIDISETKDVPMVFEVINDRGERLKPYEVFKGQLLGQLDKEDIFNKYHPLWKESIEPLEAIREEEADNFFKYYFRAKYCEAEHDHREFEGDYHRSIFSKKWNDQISLKYNVVKVKEFVTNDLQYYARLYYKLIDSDIYNKPYGEFVYYNNLNEHDRQYMLIISACMVNDKDENDKILEVSKLIDRHFVMLRLYGCYDSNTFTEQLVELNKDIRNKPLELIKDKFNENLLKTISTIKGITTSNLFDYTFFKESNTNLPVRFIRYFFARIENFIATEINECFRFTKDQIWHIVRATGPKTGYHIEHILANNDENRSIFENDDDAFQRERNRLGAILLLKGLDNISSSNEVYIDKLSTYDNADISNRWNRSLVKSFYHINKEFKEFIVRRELLFKHYDTFDADTVEERQNLLFNIIRCIWGA